MMRKIMLIALLLKLSSACTALNGGFPKDINGKLKPINSNEVIENVK